jgi:hypothetical protein
MSRIMVAITYGTLPEETDKVGNRLCHSSLELMGCVKFVKDCEEVFRLSIDAMQPGRFLVDLIPARGCSPTPTNEH